VAPHREGVRSGPMISTREEAELMFSKWMEISSAIFFAAFRPDRTVVDSFYGNIVGISDDMVLIMGDGKRAEVGLRDAQFAFVTERDLPEEVRGQLKSSFDSGIFISESDDSMFAFFEVDEK
jgi:hypothetical protein